jgi:hypothetical protein
MSKSQSQPSDPHVVPDDDGYTLTRYIEGVPRLYGALRFTYRPVSSIRRAKFRDGAKSGEGEEASLRRVANATAVRVVEWNAVDIKGSPLPINAAGVLSLHPSLQVRLMNIVVYSIDGGDADPESSEIPSESDDTDPFGEKLVDGELLEGSRKNS